MDVANKVDYPLQSFLLLDKADILGHCACGVLRDGGDDATLLWAVAFVVHVALFGRAVQSVDVVERRTESSLSGVAVAVGLICILVVVSKLFNCNDHTHVATFAR